MEYIIKIIFNLLKRKIACKGPFLPNKFFSLLFFGEPDFTELQKLYEAQNTSF